MKEEGNASLLEISFAAVILLGSMGLVSTMEPDVYALAPTKSDEGYVQSVLDAYIAQGGDARTFVYDLWDDGADPDTAFFDEHLGAYSVYLNTGRDRILLYGTETDGTTARTYFTEHTIQPLIFTPDEVYEPGQPVYNHEGLGYIFPNWGASQTVTSISHREPLDVSMSPYQDAPNGGDWRTIWDDSLQEGTIPTEIPYGVWRATVLVVVIPFFIEYDQLYYWYVLHDADGDPNVPHHALYSLEVVVP